MTVTEPIQITTPKVTVKDKVVHIESLIERNPSVVTQIEESEDPVWAIGQLLRTGAVALKAVGNEAAIENIQMRLDQLSDAVSFAMETGVRDIYSATESMVDEETGKLPTLFTEHVNKLDALLGETFDPDSKSSAIAIFEQALGVAFQDHNEHLRQAMTLEGENSPLNRLSQDLKQTISDAVEKVRKDVGDLSTKVSVDEATADIWDKTTAKGFEFEEIVHLAVSDLAAPHGDLAESVGCIKGAEANLKGDELVQLSLEDTNGHTVFFVWEAKNRKLNMRQVHEELDAAMANRNATAAIAIFAKQSQAPTTVPFHYSDNKAIVVLQEGEERSTVQLAYMWARWVVRRQINQSEINEFDIERMTALLESATRALKRTSTIKTHHTAAAKSIKAADSHLKEMDQEFAQILQDIKEEIQK